MSEPVDIAVIGGGLSGLVAARHCAERGATVTCIDESIVPGGLVGNVGKVDGFATTGGDVSGGALAEVLIGQCKALGVTFVSGRVKSLAAQQQVTVLAFDDEPTPAENVTAKVVIVASGARLRRLGVEGEEALTGRGVSQCDWCDGGFFRNQPVAVVGGGDAAFQAALHLAKQCSSVTLVMRGSQIKARRAYVQTAADNERIEFRWDCTVQRVVGGDRVEGLRLRNTAENTDETLLVDGVFVFIGTEPNTAFLPASIERDDTGAIMVDAHFRTALPGVFAIGAARSGYSGQLLSACGEAAAVAAIAVQEAEQREA